MTTVNETKNCSFKMHDSDNLNSSYIVTENVEFIEEESHNTSFISALDKSELDIEIQICEEILALDDNENSPNYPNSQSFDNKDLENIFDDPTSPFENYLGVSIEGSYQEDSVKIEIESPIGINESGYQSNTETCNNPKTEQLSENGYSPFDCNYQTENNKSEQVKIKLESPILVNESGYQSNTERRKNAALEQLSDKDSPITVMHNIKLEDIPFPKKDEDELSLFAEETDISSTVEEYEVVEDFPGLYETNFDTEQDDVGSQTNFVSEDQNIIVTVLPDYLSEERDDINDSGWESMRNLKSEEERYELVRNIWRSSKIPDPNRNLTYHSYRKRHLTTSSSLPRPRKRKATSSLDSSNMNAPKRQRSCTFLYDLNIDSLSAEKQQKTYNINQQMQSEVDNVNNIYFQQEQRLRKEFYSRRNHYALDQIYDMRRRCQRELETIQQHHRSLAQQCTSELEIGIDRLDKARNEVLQFFKFYKGMNSKDPTVLNDSQLQELEEIEKIYSQFEELYKRATT